MPLRAAAMPDLGILEIQGMSTPTPSPHQALTPAAETDADRVR